MLVCGVQARVSAGRYNVALAVIDTAASACLGRYLWQAPAGESAAGQLAELYVRAHELLERSGAEALVSWTVEPPPGGRGRRAELIEASRAEGVVMSAGGAVASVTTFDKTGNAAVRAIAGGSTAAAVEVLCAPVADLGDDDPVRRAAAAAIAWERRH